MRSQLNELESFETHFDSKITEAKIYLGGFGFYCLELMQLGSVASVRGKYNNLGKFLF